MTHKMWLETWALLHSPLVIVPAVLIVVGLTILIYEEFFRKED